MQSPCLFLSVICIISGWCICISAVSGVSPGRCWCPISLAKSSPQRTFQFGCVFWNGTFSLSVTEMCVCCVWCVRQRSQPFCHIYEHLHKMKLNTPEHFWTCGPGQEQPSRSLSKGNKWIVTPTIQDIVWPPRLLEGDNKFLAILHKS